MSEWSISWSRQRALGIRCEIADLRRILRRPGSWPSQQLPARYRRSPARWPLPCSVRTRTVATSAAPLLGSQVRHAGESSLVQVDTMADEVQAAGCSARARRNRDPEWGGLAGYCATRTLDPHHEPVRWLDCYESVPNGASVAAPACLSPGRPGHTRIAGRLVCRLSLSSSRCVTVQPHPRFSRSAGFIRDVMSAT